MMRKTITRTLTRATINVYKVSTVNGAPVVETLEPVTAWGNVTENEALKAVHAKYGKTGGITVGEITFADEVYKIDIDTFVANAELVGEQVDTEELDEETDEENY